MNSKCTQINTKKVTVTSKCFKKITQKSHNTGSDNKK